MIVWAVCTVTVIWMVYGSYLISEMIKNNKKK